LPDRYHLVVETRRATLARGMRQLNGRYTQEANRRHGGGGHLFQGRYRAVLVEAPAWLGAVCRDVLRQPVERGLAADATAWRWSSLRALAGRLPAGRSAPDWLAVERVLALYDPEPSRARETLLAAVAAEGEPSVWEALRHQVFLGSETFVAEMRERAREAAAGRGSLADSDDGDAGLHASLLHRREEVDLVDQFARQALQDGGEKAALGLAERVARPRRARHPWPTTGSATAGDDGTRPLVACTIAAWSIAACSRAACSRAACSRST